ncbi:MAG: AraC family transcriptional regulator [Aristaeellaceae bacterium]
MGTLNSDLAISFAFDGMTIQIINLKHEYILQELPFHSHGSDCYEIHYISCGCGKLCAAGSDYDLSPNTLFTTGPHVMHAQQPDLKDPMKEFCIYMKVNAPARQKTVSQLVHTFCRTDFWIGQDTQGIHGLMQQLFFELEHTYIGYQEQIRLLLSQILIAVTRNYEQQRDLNQEAAQIPQVDHKSLLIEEYFLYEYQKLSLDELSSRLFLSPRQTQRLLREYYGKTFHEKKLEARMSAACILLENSNRSIASIAEALGYSTPEQFSVTFKKQHQITPSEYRKKCQAKPGK